MIYLNIQWRLQLHSTIDWVHFWMHFLSVNNWLCCNIWNHTLLCSPVSATLTLSIYECVLFAFFLPHITHVSHRAQSKKPSESPGAVLCFLIWVCCDSFWMCLPHLSGRWTLSSWSSAAHRPWGNQTKHTQTLTHSTSPLCSSVWEMIVNIWLKSEQLIQVWYHQIMSSFRFHKRFWQAA